jgi:hypothetical protein
MASGMPKAARWTEIAVGVFFLVSAVAKAFDMDAFGVQISAYNVVKDATIVRLVAWAALLVESVLGAILAFGVHTRGFTHAASAAMILVYSLLITYAWIFHGLTDCGCLGAWITMGPVESLLKNAVLLGALGFAWRAERRTPEPDQYAPGVRRRMLIAGVVGFAVTQIAFITSSLNKPPHVPTTLDLPADKAKPFAQFVFEADGQSFDLGKGEHLVVLLNATCEHCRASVPTLNKLVETPGIPPMVALMMGSEEELLDFQSVTAPFFRAHLIPPLVFMEFIGTVPPRLSYVREGVGVQHWDWKEEVPEGEILAHFNPPRE